MTHRGAKHLILIAIAAVTLGVVGAPPAEAQLDRSQCASCHFANPYTEPAQQHLHDWDVSPHGRNQVGCESCHGGDSQTFERFQAHQDILPSSNPASPVHRTQLPSTCGLCHAGPYTNFQRGVGARSLSRTETPATAGMITFRSVGRPVSRAQSCG